MSRAARVSFSSLFFALTVGPAWSGCSADSATSGPDAASEPTVPPVPCARDEDCAERPDLPLCDLAKQACAAFPQGKEIGYRDGTAASVTFTEVYSTGKTAKPVDLAFHPERQDELWVLGYGDNSTHVGHGIGSESPSWKRYLDPAAGHFMHKPPAIAMGAANTWATCGDNDNRQNEPMSDGAGNLFMGPALFSADLEIFAKRTPTRLGSHLDMLHSSPFCRGIAHVEANWYWVFNAHDSALDKYNFAEDHGPGNDDHSDGEIYRYAAGQVKGADDGTPSHIFYDASDEFLYVADTGNARVVRLDTTKGEKGRQLPGVVEPLRAQGVMNGTAVEVVIPEGILTKPSGLEVRGELLYVTDAATSMFHVFDKQGTAIRALETGLPPDSLAGFTFGPEGKVYFTDRVGGRVLRIDPM